MGIDTDQSAALTLDGFRLSAVRDLPDLRDQIYRPTLRALVPRKERDKYLVFPKAQRLRIAIRNQGKTPTCTGQALATLIDILRLQQTTGAMLPPVSACMLYRMARDYEVDAPPEGGLLSLRSAIKAFYHHGVCLDGMLKHPYDKSRAKIKPQHWHFVAEHGCDEPMAPITTDGESLVPGNFLTVDRAKAAREVPLGAYYRIRPRLNDYHAAINDAGAVVVSAHIHDGWLRERVGNERGKIVYQSDRSVGSHAFVLIGYNEHGFLVVNSWGSEWGGYNRIGGVALWPYSDWADSIQDGWVLRLGVSTPSAFRYSVGDQGLNFSELDESAPIGSSTLGSTPCLELLGHFAHLDDGSHVTKGAYATSVASVAETVRFLRGHPVWPTNKEREKAAASRLGREEAPIGGSDGALKNYRGVLIWIAGSLEGIKDAVTIAVNRKDRIWAAKLYPYSIFWCNDFVTETTAVLNRIADEVKSRTGCRSAQFDRAIENATRGIGRAFWRDIETSAEKAMRRGGDRSLLGGEGDGAVLMDSFLSLDHLNIHIVAEGAGAIFLDRYLKSIAVHKEEKERDALLSRVKSIDLITPSIGLERVFESHWGKLFTRLQPKRARDCAVRLWIPSDDDERRLCVGAYGKSIQHLIANSFEYRVQPSPDSLAQIELSSQQRQRGLRGQPLLGMAAATSGIHRLASGRKPFVRRQLRVCTIPSPVRVLDRIHQQQLVLDPKLLEHILEAITSG